MKSAQTALATYKKCVNIHIKVRYHLSCGVKDNVTQKSICYAQLLQEQLEQLDLEHEPV